MATSLKLSLVLQAVDRATAVVRGIGRTVEKLRGPAARVGQAWGQLTGVVRGVAGAMAIASAAGAGAFYAFKRTSDEVDRLNDQAQQLGITTQRLQELGFAAQMNGSSQEELAQALEFLSQNMVEVRNGSKETTAWFQLMGISAAQLRKMDVAEVFERIADKYKEVGNVGQNAETKIAASRALMGRGGARLNQTLNQGKDSIRNYAAEANRLGIVLDKQTVRSMADFNDSFDRLRMVTFGALANGLRDVAPLLQKIVDRFVDWRSANREITATRVAQWVKDIDDKLPKFIQDLEDVAAGIGVVLGVVREAVELMGGWKNVVIGVAAVMTLQLVVAIVAVTKAVYGLTAAAAASPFGWVVAAIGLLYALVFHLDRVVDAMKRVREAVPDWYRFTTIPGLLFEGLTRKGQSILEERAGERVGTEKGRGTNRNLGGTLKIELDANGQARLKSMVKDDPNSPFDFEFYSGTQMVTR